MTGQPQGKIIVRVDRDIEEIVPLFLECRRSDLLKIRQSLQIGDYETIRKLGHNIKGAGGGFGFDAVSEFGARIEAAAERQNGEIVGKYAEELASYLLSVEIVVVDE
jgi:HPt (histidine-containing phosphotransfer) domain-containing protein